MIVKQLKHYYLLKLQEDARDAYFAALRLDGSQKRDAYVIAEADAKVHSQHAPTEGDRYAKWLSELEMKAKEVAELQKIYEDAEALINDEKYYESPDYSFFMGRYIEKHYAPKDEDFEEVETDQAVSYSLLPKEQEVSHTPA